MWVERYPFVSMQGALLVLRVSVAVLFMAHATVRVVVDTVPQFAFFLASKGLPFPLALVWLITAYELVAGTMLALGFCVRWATVGFIAIAVGGIVLIHAKLGWFVGEHGVGGVEYSLCLIVALSVIAAEEPQKGAKK